MLEMVDPPERMPVLTLAPVACSVTPADFRDLAYSPALLLSAHFDAALAADPEYQEGYEWGFDSYFAEMRHWTPDLRTCTFIDRYYCPAEVRQLLLRDAVYDPVRNPTPLAWCAAWCLGWLNPKHLSILFQHLPLNILKRCSQPATRQRRKVFDTFRHTFAKFYLQRGGEVFKLSREMGHGTVQVTELYLKDFQSSEARQEHMTYSPIGELDLKRKKKSRKKKEESE